MEKEKNYMTNESQLSDAASALYDGGWRYGDDDEFIQNFGYDKNNERDMEEVKAIMKLLYEFEKEEEKEEE